MLRIFFASKAHQVTVHVQYALGTGTFMQIIYVLGDQQKVIAKAFFKFRKCKVGGVGLMFFKPFAQEVVEVFHALLVAVVTFGRTHIVNVFVFPHAVVTAEGAQSRFRTDAGTC